MGRVVSSIVKWFFRISGAAGLLSGILYYLGVWKWVKSPLENIILGFIFLSGVWLQPLLQLIKHLSVPNNGRK